MGCRRHSLKEIDEIAIGLVTNRLWMPLNVQEIDLAFGFMIAACEDQSIFENYGTIIGDLSDTFPSAINGVQMFYKMQVLHVNDMPYLWKAIAEKNKALGVM